MRVRFGWMDLILGGLVCLSSTVCLAQERTPKRVTAGATSASVPRSPGHDQKLEWMRRNLPRLLPDAKERAEVAASLDLLTSPQLDTVVTMCLDELEARRQRQFAALKAANAAERARAEAASEEFRRRMAAYHPRPAIAFPSAYWGLNPVGFVPVITWLPDGVGLTTQAVVSPDGRDVRVSAFPVFSTIGPVYTFNYLPHHHHSHSREVP